MSTYAINQVSSRNVRSAIIPASSCLAMDPPKEIGVVPYGSFSSIDPRYGARLDIKPVVDMNNRLSEQLAI